MMRALVVGAGGLGTPALLALVARGVQDIGIIDPDRVEPSNLHRQLLYRESDVGAPKVEVAARALRAHFPSSSLRLQLYKKAFCASEAALLEGYDVVLDGTDRFETKLALNDACVDFGTPYVFAAVAGFQGQAMGVLPGAACVRCLFDEAPGPGEGMTCETLGILGPIAGIVAAKQAEIALALSEAELSAVNQLWVYDGAADRARQVRLRRMEDCKGCGSRRAVRGALLPGVVPDEEKAPVLNLVGQVCPETYIQTRRALDRLPARGRIWVHLTSDESARNVPVSAIAAGHRVLARSTDGRVHRILLERGDKEKPMAITVRIPTPLRKFTDGKDKVEIEGDSVAKVLSGLEEAHPGIKARICDENGVPKRFVNIYYKDEDIRFLKSVDTQVEDGAELSIVPAIAGGC